VGFGDPASGWWGWRRKKTAVLSFLMDGILPHDIGTILDQEGIAIRTGRHCAQPVMDRFGISAAVRACFHGMFWSSRIPRAGEVRHISLTHI
jgi:selenocysteine lyase/cysteine desulfurase